MRRGAVMRWLLLAWMLWAGVGTARAEWYEAAGANVRVLAEGRGEDARELAERIERFDAAMRYLRRLPPAENAGAGRLTVYVLRSQDAVEKLAGAQNIAGFYRPSARGSIAFVPARAGFGGQFDLSATTVLLHEYTHHFMFRNFEAAYPAWLAEGYAEFHSIARFEKDGSVLFGTPADHRAWEIFAGERVSLDKLLDPGTERLPMSAIYGRGWLLTHYLHFADTRKGQLGAYIRAINEGKTGLEAGRAAFGDLKTLDRELDAYAKRRLEGLRVGAEAIAPSPVTLRMLGPAESAAMPIHIVSTRGVTDKEAKQLLPRARRALAPFTADAFAQGVLAEAEFDAGNVAEAGRAAQYAVAADPRSRQGLVYSSMALAAAARARGDTSEATMRAIRAPLFAANRLDPDDALPMLMLYRSYLDLGQTPPESARKAILYAQKLAPEAPDLRMLAAAEYVSFGNREAARALVAPLAFNAHGGGGEGVQALMAAIDAGDARAAREVLTGKRGENADKPKAP